MTDQERKKLFSKKLNKELELQKLGMPTPDMDHKQRLEHYNKRNVLLYDIKNIEDKLSGSLPSPEKAAKEVKVAQARRGIKRSV